MFCIIACMSEEAHGNESFFTNVGCMDGRVQKAVNKYGSLVFGAEFADTITRAGLDGLLAREDVEENVLESIKNMIMVSVEKHKSHGIVVHGHSECAGNPVSDEQHEMDIKKSVEQVKEMLGSAKIKVKGVYVVLSPRVKIIEVT